MIPDGFGRSFASSSLPFGKERGIRSKTAMRIGAFVLLFGLMGLLGSRPEAAPSLKLTDGVTTVIVTDQGVGGLNPLVGVVTASPVVGSWFVNVSTGITAPQIGSLTLPHMDLSSVNVGGPGTLTISFSSDFFGPTPTTTFQAHIGGTTD